MGHLALILVNIFSQLFAPITAVISTCLADLKYLVIYALTLLSQEIRRSRMVSSCFNVQMGQL